MGLVLLGLLGFDPEMGFVGLQFQYIAGFSLVNLLLGLCLCFWVCGFWFSILKF